MSATTKVKMELKKLLNLEENSNGLTFKEVWEKLEETELKNELYNKKGEKRLGLLTGLSTRIKEGKVEGIKIIKNSENKIIYVSNNTQVEFLCTLTSRYLQEVNKLEVNKEKLSKKQKEKMKIFKNNIIELETQNKELKKIAIKLNKK